MRYNDRVIHDFRINVAKNMRKIIRESGLTYEEFAESVDLTRTTLYKYMEMAMLPSLERLVLICKKYNVSLDSMAFGTARIRKNEQVAQSEKESE